MKNQLKRMLTAVPGLRQTSHVLLSRFFPGSGAYWETRYQNGRTSGAGSYGRLAEFKAGVLNEYVATAGIRSIIEFGCGDGNQLSLACYQRYIGLDVAKSAIRHCAQRFADDSTKSFFLYDPDCFVDRGGHLRCELAISLDVIYHLVEDEVFHRYMSHLFAAADKAVIIYSSDSAQPSIVPHVRHRPFSRWVSRYQPDWKLARHVSNPYPYMPGREEDTSWADFFIFERPTSGSAIGSIG